MHTSTQNLTDDLPEFIKEMLIDLIPDRGKVSLVYAPMDSAFLNYMLEGFDDLLMVNWKHPLEDMFAVAYNLNGNIWYVYRKHADYDALLNMIRCHQSGGIVWSVVWDLEIE